MQNKPSTMSSENLNLISSSSGMECETEDYIFKCKKHNRRQNDTKSSVKDCGKCKEDRKSCSNTSIKSNSHPNEDTEQTNEDTGQTSGQAPCQSGLQPDGTIVECICDPGDAGMSDEENVETSCICNNCSLDHYLKEQEDNLFGNTEVVTTTNREIIIPVDKVLLSQVIRNKTKYKYKKGIGKIERTEWMTAKYKVNDGVAVPCKHTKSDNSLSRNRFKCGKCSQPANPDFKSNLQTSADQNISTTTNASKTNTKNSCKKGCQLNKPNDNDSLKNEDMLLNESSNKLFNKESKDKSLPESVELLDSKTKLSTKTSNEKSQPVGENICKICCQPIKDSEKTLCGDNICVTCKQTFNVDTVEPPDSTPKVPVEASNEIPPLRLSDQDQKQALSLDKTEICKKCHETLNKNNNKDAIASNTQDLCGKCKQLIGKNNSQNEHLNDGELNQKSLERLESTDICDQCLMQPFHKDKNENQQKSNAELKDLCKKCFKKLNENRANADGRKYCKICSRDMTSQSSLHSNKEYVCKKCNRTITKENIEKERNAQPKKHTNVCKRCNQPESRQSSVQSNNDILCKICNQTINKDNDQKGRNAHSKENTNICKKCMRPMSRQTQPQSKYNICKTCGKTINKEDNEKEKRTLTTQNEICKKCKEPVSRQSSPKSSNTDICKYCNQPINKNNTKDLVVLKDIPEKDSYPTDTKSNNSSSVSLNSRRFCEKCSRPLGEELNSKSVQPINSKNLCEKCAASLKKSVQEKPSNPMKSTSVCAKCSKSITEKYDKDKKNTNNNEELCQKCKQQIQQTKSALPSNRKHLCKKCSQRIGEDSSNTPSLTKNKMVDKCEKCSQLLNNISSSNTPSLTKSKMADKCEKCSQLLNNISEKSFEERTNISPRKQKSASSVNESFESAKCCMSKNTREVKSEFCNGIEIVTELGPKRSCVPNSDTYIQNDKIANTSDMKSSNENINSASRKNVCVPLKDAIYKNADCVANMQDQLLKSNDLGVTSSLQPDTCPDTCAECDADDSQATKTSAKYDIFSRILDVYKACSCKICNCVTSKVNSFKQGRKCECNPCQCESCELMNENIKGADENKDASNKTTTCKCNPCECMVCKNKITTETETCACKPCKCEKCVHGNKNQNYTVGHTVLMAVGEQNQMQNPCKCAPCECLNCQSRPTIVQPVLMTNEMSTCIAVHPNCHCDLATCPQATCLPDDQPACSCVRASRVMQKPTTGHNDREFDVHIASVPTRDVNKPRLNTFKRLLAEDEDFDRNYPEKYEYNGKVPFVYASHRIDSSFAKPGNINRFEESYFQNLKRNYQDYNFQYLRNLPPSKQYLTNDIFGHDYVNVKESSNPWHPMVQRLSYNNKGPEKPINHKCNKRDLTPRYYIRRRDTIRSNDAIVNSMFETRRTINGDMEYESSNIVKSSFSSHTSGPTSLEPTLKTYSLFDINTCPPAESLIAEYELCEPEISDKVLTKKSIDSTHITQEFIGKTVQDTTNIQVELSDKFDKTVCEIKACKARLESTVREAKYFTEIMSSMLRKFEILNQEIQNIASQLLSNRYRW